MNPLPEGTRRIRKKSKAVSGQRTQAKTVKSTKKVADVSQKTGMPNCRFLQYQNRKFHVRLCFHFHLSLRQYDFQQTHWNR